MSDPPDNLRRLVDLYRVMARIRAFDETALAAHNAGEISGPLHVSIRTSKSDRPRRIILNDWWHRR